jgi:hypothetical protein
MNTRRIDMGEAALCECGCGEPTVQPRYPSQGTRRFLNGHQHRGAHNGNYRGGKAKRCCPVCLGEFERWPSEPDVTCGADACYRAWQGLTTAARGRHKVIVRCDTCGAEVRRFPSQVKDKNYCNRSCLGLTKGHENNGRWQGGKWRWMQSQVLIRDAHRCVICGFDLAVDVHHVTAREKGGTDAPSNLLTLCPNHHRLADIGIINVEHLRRLDWAPPMPPPPDPPADAASR